MIRELLILAFLTALPLFELRLSIPLAITGGKATIPLVGMTLGLNPIPWPIALVAAIIVNWIIAIIIYNILDALFLFITRFKRIHEFKERVIERAQKRVEGQVHKFGTIGLALFIGVPLPGSGVYTGALGAYALGMSKKDFYIASLIGVIIAGIAVTIITLAVKGTIGIL